MWSGVSSLSVLAHGWLCYAESGHTKEGCFSPVTGHPLTCACSVGWTSTLSSLYITAVDIYIINGGCEVYHHISECILLGVDFPNVPNDHFMSVNFLGTCGL